MKAWWFCHNSHRLRYGDDRVAKVGVIHAVGGPPQLCVNGLHASVRVLDAYRYAPGWSMNLFRVELSGAMHNGFDKIAAQKRKYLAYLPHKEVKKITNRIGRQIRRELILLLFPRQPKYVVEYLTSRKPDSSVKNRLVDAIDLRRSKLNVWSNKTELLACLRTLVMYGLEGRFDYPQTLDKTTNANARLERALLRAMKCK